MIAKVAIFFLTFMLDNKATLHLYVHLNMKCLSNEMHEGIDTSFIDVGEYLFCFAGGMVHFMC